MSEVIAKELLKILQKYEDIQTPAVEIMYAAREFRKETIKI